MSDHTTCCTKCFWMLVEKNKLAARLWIELCDDHSEFDAISLNKKELNAIRKLELMGFLITTDIFNDILIKVTGRRTSSSRIVYCGGKCNEY